MGKLKSNPNLDPKQDELDLGPSEEQDGTVPAPSEQPVRARVPRITAGDAASAHAGHSGAGEDADDGRIAKLPAFAMDGAWNGGGMPTGFTPVRGFRLKRLILLGAIVAFAAAVGALAGSLATGGLGASGDRGAAAAPPLTTALDRMEQQLAALRTSVETSTQDMHARTARIAERLDRSERAQAEPTQKLAKISDALDRLERRSTQTAEAVAAAAPDVTGAIGAPAGDAKKTPIVNGWSLYQARHGVALIEGRYGLVQVEPGDTLPGLGKVETIRKQDGRWVVVTSRGLIVER
jgi:hypothetical protein